MGADMDPMHRSTDKAYIHFEVNQSFNKTFGSSVDFCSSLNEFSRGASPPVERTLRSNHGANIFGVLDYLHFAKHLTVR